MRPRCASGDLARNNSAPSFRSFIVRHGRVERVAQPLLAVRNKRRNESIGDKRIGGIAPRYLAKDFSANCCFTRALFSATDLASSCLYATSCSATPASNVAMISAA